MNKYKIVLLAGDGIGPEISDVSKKVLKKLSKKHNFDIEIIEKLFGGIAYEKYRNPAPDETLDQCKKSDAVLLACVGDIKYDSLAREFRPESGLLKLRSALNLFANIRPVKIRKSLIDASTLKKEIVENVDLIVVRELIGGIYFGKPRGHISNTEIPKAFNTMVYDSAEIERITEIAIKIAHQRNKKICSVDKSNVLEVSQLWRDTVLKSTSKHKNLSLSNMYVDNAAMQLIRDPSQFDVILTSNLFGDILSDLAAMLTGSIGMLPSASLNNNGPGVFEPVHGSAPDIAGKNIANPIAMLLSASMMLKIGLNEEEAAESLENAVDKVLSKGYRTADLANSFSEVLSCSEIGEKIIEEI
ncbi:MULTISPECIES: 3-isopropylmalate dehydrogenase [Prochlorococcus]|uniref:3-isopropylmalate dehydrogenase n=1 Tax=Prochlorococcus marinus str. MIT 9116 TaxID=167544 RepID=A0A0A1ZLJ5_PROMR|nr:3-isopropylmalate dehydrogenase [Prochlorococcus marinus]KGF89685.1 3-isopropylmalate dehydrogenase [Prochlorococcus marinus str. MIT 9107]KGF90305.1 3-isopropylmalate dehydrogenase [Prochlorococcus marinus str. MIT 9116]KGF92785.1 3-isopropylmalate dehydrogenase [Prochlorococcus marinus str. MIT 9123]